MGTCLIMLHLSVQEQAIFPKKSQANRGNAFGQKEHRAEKYFSVPTERSLILLSKTSQGTPKEASSSCQRPRKELRKKPHPPVKDIPKNSERSLNLLPKTSQSTPKEASSSCREPRKELRKKSQPPALLRRVSACCSLYRSTRGCQAGGRWG